MSRAKPGQSAESGDVKSVKSAKSTGSKTSINVKIPSEQAALRSPEPTLSRGQTPDAHRAAFSPAFRGSPQHEHYINTGRSLSPSTRALTPQARYGHLSPPRGGVLHSPPHRSHSQPSHGTIPPQGTPQQVHLTGEQLERLTAAKTIERAWLSYRDRQMFKLLKHAVCAAEHSLSYEILRKVAPKEADFLKDKAMNATIRFRFGGTEFPPMIYFKIYTHTGGKGVNYISGKKTIKPASPAARQACELMGNRKFYNQVLQDTLHHRTNKITDEVDVTTLKDYMQYLNILDETPAYLGGKENSWRKLTLEVLSRSVIFYDVVDFLYSHNISTRLRQQIPILVKQPLSQSMQIAHIKIVSEYRPMPDGPQPEYLKHSSMTKSASHLSSRRSKQARSRAKKMRQMYEQQREEEDAPRSQRIQFRETPQMEDAEELGEEWEEEADKLYEWTQELSFEDLATPRLVSTASYLT